jgi:serine/threonine-protein kinase
VPNDGVPPNRLFADRYQLHEELGQGGMAHVYRATDRRYGTTVALKLLRREFAGSVMARRFAREVRIASELTHPNILPVLDAGELQGIPFYVMPIVEGMTLEGVIRDVRVMAINQALRIAGDVADALAYAHGHDVIHRDIKPSNILLSEGRALVADFGIARHVSIDASGKLTDSGIAIGTAPYMSPEQARAGAVDGRSDQYALGCMLFEMLTGRPPYGSAATQRTLDRHANDPIPSAREKRIEISISLDAAIRKALAKQPADRFASAAEFRSAFEAGASPEAGPSWLQTLRSVLRVQR